MNNSRAQDALRLLREVAADREHDLLQYSISTQEDSDDEADSESPIFDSFYTVQGNEAILQMTNFTAPEFRKLYSILEPFITTCGTMVAVRRPIVQTNGRFLHVVSCVETQKLIGPPRSHVSRQSSYFYSAYSRIYG